MNLLTSSAFGPGELFSGNAMPRGDRLLFDRRAHRPGRVGGAAPAMTQGDLSSWIVAGSFLSRREGAHSYDLGLSYSTQEYQGANPLALAAVDRRQPERRRGVGGRSMEPRPGRVVRIRRPIRALRLPDRSGQFSPHASLTLEPRKGTRVTAVLAQRMLAPGAEEFLAPTVPGPWLPPERTFSPRRRERAAGRTGAIARRAARARVRRRLRVGRAPILPGRRRPVGHDLRHQRAGEFRVDRSLLRGDRR